MRRRIEAEHVRVAAVPDVGRRRDADHRHAVFLRNGGGRQRQVRRVRTDQEIDLVLRDQFLVELRDVRGARRVVVQHEFDRPAQQRATVVDVVFPHLHAALLFDAEVRDRPGERCRYADLDRCHDRRRCSGRCRRHAANAIRYDATSAPRTREIVALCMSVLLDVQLALRGPQRPDQLVFERRTGLVVLERRRCCACSARATCNRGRCNPR